MFATTHWSVVLAAASEGSAGADAALEKLCRLYWYPLYAYLRRRGCGEADAQDLVQGFFMQLLQHGSLSRVTRERGKFRSFLLASINLFLADAKDRDRAVKRGGGAKPVALDALEAEERYRLEPADEADSQRIFERRWALTVLEEVMRRLREEYHAAGKADLLEQIQPFLLGDRSHGTYAEIGARLTLSEGAVKMAALRLRQRYAELFREVISETVSDRAEAEEELRYLSSVIAR